MPLQRTWTILRDAGSAWIDDKATRLSAAVAFYTILSLAPLFMIVVAIAGAVFGRDAATGGLTAELREFVGDAGAEVASTAIQQSDKPAQGIVATIIGFAMLLIGASGVFGELQDALNTVWDVKPKPGRRIRGIIRDRFFSFAMVLVIGFLLLVSLALTTGLMIFSSYTNGLVPNLLIQTVNFLLGIAIVSLLFAMIFKMLPDAEVAWRDVWFGAIVSAGLFTLGKYLIGIYLGFGGVTTPFGAAGALVAFVVWVYYSCGILFFGAELTRVTAQHAGRSADLLNTINST